MHIAHRTHSGSPHDVCFSVCEGHISAFLVGTLHNVRLHTWFLMSCIVIKRPILHPATQQQSAAAAPHQPTNQQTGHATFAIPMIRGWQEAQRRAAIADKFDC